MLLLVSLFEEKGKRRRRVLPKTRSLLPLEWDFNSFMGAIPTTK